VHDVLDPRDLVPDEAQQLLHSGHPVDDLLVAAQGAARADDLQELRRIADQLGQATRARDWPYHEPSDPEVLAEGLSSVARLPLDVGRLRDRLHGAWLGRCVANTLGKPVEGLTRSEVELYLRAVGQWPQTGYLPYLDELPAGVSHLHESAPYASAGRFADAPRDDDVDWTILGLAMLEEHGASLSTEDIARSWLDRLPFTQTFTAERAAYRNLVRGVPVDQAALVENPYREWIGALIRGDIFGYTHPGDPGVAARLAIVDARLSHVGNGLYGEMWAAALVSAALAVDDARAALAAALTVIPNGSRLSRSQETLLNLRDAGASAESALGWIDSELGHYNWVHTVNNAALISLGLLWGSDFMGSVALTISGGRDTDSTSATVGSVFGALHGADSIPSELVGTTHVRVRSAVRDFDRITIAELAERTLRLVDSSPAYP
jgi:ADP-ribosylglycohydrolase